MAAQTMKRLLKETLMGYSHGEHQDLVMTLKEEIDPVNMKESCEASLTPLPRWQKLQTKVLSLSEKDRDAFEEALQDHILLYEDRCRQ